jgi:hypothetical protein
MAIKVPNQGEADALEAFLNIAPAEDLVLKLYKNDKVPADGDTEADYTEADFNGYAPIPLNASGWTISEGNPTTAEQPTQSFVSAAGGQNQDVYGYYVEGADSGRLKWSERFTDGPYTIVNLDDEIKIVPKFSGQSGS